MKGALRIAYPGYYGLGEWEPAVEIAEGKYHFEGFNTDQIDVRFLLISVPGAER